MFLNKNIRWQETKHPILSTGRNGDVETSGVTLYSSPRGVDLGFITSKGVSGNGSIGLPPDPKTLRALAKLLNEAAKFIESWGDSSPFGQRIKYR